MLDRQRWATRDELRLAIVTWIERTYDRRRRQASLGRLTPIEFEIIMVNPDAQAAGPTHPTCDPRVQQPHLSTRSLYRHADVGVTVRGTPGMEMAAFGKPVLTWDRAQHGPWLHS